MLGAHKEYQHALAVVPGQWSSVPEPSNSKAFAVRARSSRPMDRAHRSRWTTTST